MDRPVPPPRTPDQRRMALDQANQTRSLRAEDKRRIKRRELDARLILNNPPEHWSSAKVGDLIQALPGVGDLKVDRMLRSTGISSSRTLQGMTDDARVRLAEAIKRYCPSS